MDSSPEGDDVEIENETQETPDESTGPDNRGKRKASGNRSQTNPSKAKKPLATRSHVWKDFTRTEENHDVCTCNHCHRKFGCASSAGTSNLKKHLLSCKAYKAWSESQAPGATAITSDGKLTSAKVSEDVFRNASNELLVLAELPLSFIESVAWRHFCNRVNLYTPHSRRTATRDIVKMYVSRKAALKNWFKSTKQRVSLTTDIWTAQATGASYMVITVHFVDGNWQLRKLIIGFKYITDHRGHSIANVLLECLAEWGIQKVFTITVDNATANTSALRRFQGEFSTRGNEALVMEGEFLHVRCAAHIINLIVKDGLAEIGDNVLAIRNAVQYVRSSTPRLKSFELRVESGKMTRGSLPLDVKTRWNSTFLMLQRAMKFRLAFDKMEAEDRLYNDHFNETENGNKRIGPPAIDDWNVVQRLVKFLIIFYNSTLVVSASSSVCSHKCYEYNSRHSQEATVQPSQSTEASSSTGQENVVAENFEGMEMLDDDVEYERMDFAYTELVAETGVQEATDELEMYLKDKVENPINILGTEYDVLSWWRLNSPKYPVLSEMAKDVFAMQVSSVASESAFSTSGRLIDPYRSCLTHYMIEVLMCTEQWMKSDIKLREKRVVTNAQMLADFELHDKLEKGQFSYIFFIFNSFF
ncbi:hypothetical protein N665_0109s0061 [Sinapis alba]|nr:hypothetical protein N665_0109s0061 [Sinapis alba]